MKYGDAITTVNNILVLWQKVRSNMVEAIGEESFENLVNILYPTGEILMNGCQKILENDEGGLKKMEPMEFYNLICLAITLDPLMLMAKMKGVEILEPTPSLANTPFERE